MLSLTYVGLGDTARWFPSFGNTIRNGLDQAGRWTWLIPLAVLASAVVAATLVGDALGETVDHRARR